MDSTDRDLSRFPAETFDLIIIGGGIYGIMLSLEAGFHGKRALLLEKDDFGGATTYNHLRTLHGGLRYLQTLDLHRFFESVNERRWFFSHFPHLVRRLPCLMPLYDKGIRRKSIFNLALWLNDFLSKKRNENVVAEKHLPDGYTIGPQDVNRVYPMVDLEGLTGGAIWYDGMIMEPERLLVEIMQWSAKMGASLLNYVEVVQLLSTENQVRGIKAVDRISGSQFECHAEVVVNAAGPWCRDIAKMFDNDYKKLFPEYLLLWNILFRREALSDYSVTVSPQKGRGQTYFVHNWKGRMLVGTGQELVKYSGANHGPDDNQISSFLDDINQAIPSIKVKKNDIDHIYSGLLPGTENGHLTKREVILNHEDTGGPKGLFSVAGIKFTTSRLVAQKVISLIFPESKRIREQEDRTSIKNNNGQKLFAFDWLPDEDDDSWTEMLREIVRTESVIHLDDLLLRRTSLGENKQRLQIILPEIRCLFPWDDQKWNEEVKRLPLIIESDVAA